MSVVLFAYEKQAGPVPATGQHGLGQGTWLASDPVENTVQRLTRLLEQRIGAIRDAAVRG